MDFMHDRFADGSAYRLLTIVDIYSRECVALHADRRLSAADVIGVLNSAIKRRGKPRALRCDNGSEFASIAVDQWAYWNEIKIDFSRPGKPTDNAFCESSTGPCERSSSMPRGFKRSKRCDEQRRNGGGITTPKGYINRLGHKTPEEFALTAKTQPTS